ncbi:hypothetical protein [Mesorhizobium sp.]|uniref:hypothetical protein n=1 Tax=Mesorhizobium sp. TaxID=1871066 RepID=UPI0025E48C0D|nr:hypothetical protein [Mesorhizobium sp.]
MTRDPITAFGLFVLALLRRPATPPAGARVPLPTTTDEMAALRAALQRQIATDEARDA